MVRSYSSVHADDEILIRKMSGDTACHGIPHQIARCRTSNTDLMPRQLRSPITLTLSYFVSEIRSFWRNAMTFEVGVAEMPLRLRSSSYILSGAKFSPIQI